MNRYAVVFALFVLSMVTFIDRVCLSAGKNSIAAEINLSDTAMGLVFSAFALGYALGQIPAGWFADRAGPRVATSMVVGCWSLLIILAGTAWNLASLVAFVFLFGVGEAGAFPCGLRAICNWLPLGERGRANGLLFSRSRLGAAVSFPLLAWMLARWQWRLSFQILGVVGLIWAALWLLWFRDHPAAPQVSGPAPPEVSSSFVGILRSTPMVLAIAQYFALNFTFFISVTWMLPYLKSKYN